MATRQDRDARNRVQGTRGQGMTGQEFRTAPNRPWDLPPLEMIEPVSNKAAYADFVRAYNDHVHALNEYITNELDRIWNNLAGWDQGDA